MTGKKKLKMPNHFSTKGTSMIVCLPCFLSFDTAVCLHFSRLRASVKKSLLKPVVQEKKDVQTSNSNHERDIYLKEVCIIYLWIFIVYLLNSLASILFLFVKYSSVINQWFKFQLKSLERSHQNLRDELKTTLFYARMTLLMTVMLAFMVIFFILPNLIWTNGGCDSTEMNDDTFQNESNHEL